MTFVNCYYCYHSVQSTTFTVSNTSIKFISLNFCFEFTGRDNWRCLLRSFRPAQIQFHTRTANRLDGSEDDRNVQNSSHTRWETDKSKSMFYTHLFYFISCLQLKMHSHTSV